MANLERWIPFKRDQQGARSGGGLAHRDPFNEMQRDMARMLESFWRDPFSGMESWFGDFSPTRFTPTVDVSDEGKTLHVTAELPGMSADDIELDLQDSTLILRGEKKHEETSGEKEHGYYHTERSYGFFQRAIPLPTDVRTEQAEATFKNGVLDVRLPKAESSDKGKRLQIKSG